jgi:hypothetical protein
VEKGWTPAGELQPGDQFVSLGGERARVASLRDTELVEPVFNLSVADNHTYFVSDGDPGFSVLAHNVSPRPMPGNGQSSDESSWYDVFSAEKNGLNAAVGKVGGWIGGLFRSGTKPAEQWKKERAQAAMAEQNGPIESWLPKAHEIDALPDFRTEHRKRQEAQRDAAVAQQPGGEEQLAREAQRLESRKNLADNVTAFTPGLNDIRDLYEFGTGKDFVRGSQLTVQQRNQTAMMSMIPGASGSEGRKLDKALKEGTDLVRPSTATTAPGKSFIKREHLQAAAGETALRQSVEKIPGEVIVKAGGPVTQNGADIVSFNKNTGQVTLWDNKALKDAEMVQPSKTFTKESSRAKALENAGKAIDASNLPEAEKAAARNAIKEGNVRYITHGSGVAKNSVVEFGNSMK